MIIKFPLKIQETSFSWLTHHGGIQMTFVSQCFIIIVCDCTTFMIIVISATKHRIFLQKNIKSHCMHQKVKKQKKVENFSTSSIILTIWWLEIFIFSQFIMWIMNPFFTSCTSIFQLNSKTFHSCVTNKTLWRVSEWVGERENFKALKGVHNWVECK